MTDEVGLEIFNSPTRISFTVPVHEAASFAQQYGYYEEVVRGQGYYVTRNHRGASVLGPKRHRGLGWLPKVGVRRPQKQAAALAAPSGAEGTPPRRSRLRDREWHRAVQHTAVDVTMWVCGLAVSAAFLKGAWWFLCL